MLAVSNTLWTRLISWVRDSTRFLRYRVRSRSTRIGGGGIKLGRRSPWRNRSASHSLSLTCITPREILLSGKIFPTFSSLLMWWAASSPEGLCQERKHLMGCFLGPLRVRFLMEQVEQERAVVAGVAPLQQVSSPNVFCLRTPLPCS